MRAKRIEFIVELEDGCFLAVWDGDPGRTLVFDSAKLFHSEEIANDAITKAREYRPFENARIIEVEVTIATT